MKHLKMDLCVKGNGVVRNNLHLSVSKDKDNLFAVQ